MEWMKKRSIKKAMLTRLELLQAEAELDLLERLVVAANGITIGQAKRMTELTRQIARLRGEMEMFTAYTEKPKEAKEATALKAEEK